MFWRSLWCDKVGLTVVSELQQQPFDGRLSGTTRVGRYQKKHSPAHTHPGQLIPLSPFSICNGPWHPLYSAYMLDSPLEQPVSRYSLVFPLVLNPQLHTPCISSPNHHHLFAAHAHTNAACSAAISMLYFWVTCSVLFSYLIFILILIDFVVHFVGFYFLRVEPIGAESSLETSNSCSEVWVVITIEKFAK